MKKNKVLVLLLLILIGINKSYGFTNVPGGTVSGTWTLSGSPYLVQGAIMIANGTTLTIEPGVKVEFQGSYKFLILGRINAIGSALDSITFTAADTSIGWLGIRFDNTASSNDTSKFKFCRIMHGKAVALNNSGGAFYFNNYSKVIISNSFITNCYSESVGGAFYLNNSSPNINSNIIASNKGLKGGGIYSSNASPLINNNTFVNNYAFGTTEGGGAICCMGGSPLITNNEIFNNEAFGWGGGIYCYSSSAVISNNIVSYNTALKGAGIFSVALSSPPTNIIYNIISNNSASQSGGGLFCENCNISNSIVTNNFASLTGGGISFTSLNSQNITNTTISNNLSQKGGAVYCIYSNPNFHNCILWNDSASISGKELFLEDEPSDPNFYYCDITGGQNSFGINVNMFYTGIYSNNIDSNPQFSNPSLDNGADFDGVLADWSLQSNSPCINAGNPTGTYPTIDIAGSPRICNGVIDMGAYENIITEIANNDIEKYNVYSSHASGNLVINKYENKEKNIIITIFNVNGQIVKTAPLQNEITEINIISFENGVYILNIKSDNSSFVTKFIK